MKCPDCGHERGSPQCLADRAAFRALVALGIAALVAVSTIAAVPVAFLWYLAIHHPLGVALSAMATGAAVWVAAREMREPKGDR